MILRHFLFSLNSNFQFFNCSTSRGYALCSTILWVVFFFFSYKRYTQWVRYSCSLPWLLTIHFYLLLFALFFFSFLELRRGNNLGKKQWCCVGSVRWKKEGLSFPKLWLLLGSFLGFVEKAVTGISLSQNFHFFFSFNWLIIKWHVFCSLDYWVESKSAMHLCFYFYCFKFLM